MRRSIKRLVSLGVIFSLLFQPHAFASNVPNQQNLKNEIEQFANDTQAKLDSGTRAWGEEQENLAPQLLAAAERLEAEAKRLSESRGEEYLADQISKNQFIVEDNELGIKMEYRIIDGHRVPRILFRDEVYIVVDEKIIPRDSKHLQQYIARTHHESGPGRLKIGVDGQVEKTIFGNDKKTTGRNLSILFLNDDLANLEKLAKPKATQWKWWKEYFISKYKKPTIEDFTMALVTGVAMQGTLALGATYLKHHFLGTDFSLAPTYWTMAYGLGIGTLISFYRNWTVNSGTRLTRVMKSQTVSTLYAVGLVMAVSDGSFGDRLSTLSIFSSEGRAKDVSITANGIMNNYAKDYWNQVPRIRETTRENAGFISWRIPFTDKKLNWKKSSLEAQVLYLIPWSINVISLMTLAATDWFKIPGTSITVPILQLAGIPIAMYWSKWYARLLAKKAQDDPDAKVRARELDELATQHESAWQNTFGIKLSEIPGKISGWVKSITRSTQELSKKCFELLKGPV